MAEQEVTGISGQLALDITQWSEAIDAAKSELRGLTQAAGSVAVNVRAPKAAAATGRQGMAVTPAFSVTQHAVRDLRADINQTLRAHAGQGQAVGVPIKLGRVAWGAIRTEIAARIGEVPIKVIIGSVAGGSSKNVLAAMMSVSTGSTMGRAQADIESAAASRGIPKRASGGPAQAHRPIVVGDAGRAEVYVPDSHGRVYPSLAEWRRREDELRQRNLASRNSPTHAEIDSELHDRYRFAFRARGGNVSPVNAGRRERAFDITHRYGNIKGWQNQMWRQQEAAENAERFESAQREESWASEMWSLRSGRARAQGGPAHKGGLPRGYHIEFYSPQNDDFDTRNFGGRLNKPGSEFKSIKKPTILSKQYVAGLVAVVVKDDKVAATFPFTYSSASEQWGVPTPYGSFHPDYSLTGVEHRRKGLATAAYVKTERFTGRPISPSSVQLTRGKAFWGQPNRPFGKIFGSRLVDPQVLSTAAREDAMDQSSLEFERRQATRAGKTAPPEYIAARSIAITGERDLLAEARAIRAAHITPPGPRQPVPVFGQPAGWRSTRRPRRNDPQEQMRRLSFTGEYGQVDPWSAPAHVPQPAPVFGEGSLESVRGLTRRAGGTPRYAANIRRAARSLTPEQIAFGRQWFPAQNEWLRGLSRQYGLPEQTVMGMAAAQSGATSWGGSKTKLLRILEAHRTGAAFPYPGGLSSDRLTERILRGETPEAVIGHMPKIGAFYQNLSGNLSAYTLDRWGMRTATRGVASKTINAGPRRDKIEAAYRKVAAEYNMEPAEFQAATWAYEKQRGVHGRGGGGAGGLARFMAQGGPAHKGGLPRGYSIEFHSPIGEETKMPPRLTMAGRVEKGLKPVGKPIFKGKPGYRSEMSALYGLVKKGEETVGTFPFSYDAARDALHPEMSFTEPAHRRKGLATAVYVKAERFTGRPVEPAETQLLRGRALWAQPDRPFGKRFGEKRISSNDLSRIKDEDEFLASGAPEQMVRPSTRPPLGPIGRRIAERLGPQVTDQRLVEWRMERMERLIEARFPMRRAAKMIREEEANAQSYVASYPGNTLPWHRAGGGPVRQSRSLEARAIRAFGLTDDVREAGYITPGGRMLDFSGRHVSSGYRREGDRFVPTRGDYFRGQRLIDHRELSPLGLGGSEGMERMLRRGFARITSNSRRSPGLEIDRPLTGAQFNRIVREYRGASDIDIDVSRWGKTRDTVRSQGPGRSIASYLRDANAIASGPMKWSDWDRMTGFPKYRMAGGPTFRVGDPNGLHMRPSAYLTKMARKFDAVVTARNETIGREALSPLLANEPMSMYGWMSLGARKGHRVELIGRGNEADKAVRALGKLIQNPRLTDLARSQIKNRGIFSDIGRRSDGGDAGGQPYIVNEIGREKFVPDRLRHLIPKDVWAQLPKRAGGGLVDKIRKQLSAKEGPFEIPGGEQVFYPPEDGWIIPSRLKNKVPRRAEGTPDEGTPGRYEVQPTRMLPKATGAASSSFRPTRQLQDANEAWRQARERQRQAYSLQGNSRAVEAERAATEDVYGQPPIAKTKVIRRAPAGAVGTRRGTRGAKIRGGQFVGELYEPQGSEELRAAHLVEANAWNARPTALRTSGEPVKFSAAERLESARGFRRDLRESRNAPQVNPDYRAGMQATQIEAQARRGVTPRSLISSMSEFFAGGGRARATATKEAQDLRRELEGMIPKELRGTTTAMEHFSLRVHESGVNLEREQVTLQELTKAHGKNSEQVRGSTRVVKELSLAHQDARSLLDEATEKTKRYDTALEAASGGIAKNFLAATGGIAAFQLGMQGVTEGIRIAGVVAGPLVDQMTGFHSVTTKVTSDLAAAAKETGNVPAAIAAAAGTGGLGTAGYAYAQGALSPGVTMAGGANAGGQGMQLRRAAFGAQNNQAPTGMFGGYGGLLGSSFLATEAFGGGKGFLENLAGEAAGYRAQVGNIKSNPALDVAKFVTNPLSLPWGPLQGTGEGTITPSALKAQEVEFADYTEAVKRGSHYLGQNASSLQLMTKETVLATKGLAVWDQSSTNLTAFAKAIGGTAPDEVQKLLAAGGTIVDSTGQAVSSAKDLMTFLAQSAQGTMLPTAQEYAAQQKVALQGAQAIADAQRQYAQQIQIPGQLGQQLAAQPLLPAQAGIATPAQMAAIGGRPGMGAVGAAGAYVQQSLAGTQKIQNQITQVGADAIKAQADFIAKNITTYTPTTGITIGTATSAGTPDAAGANPGQTAGPDPAAQMRSHYTDSMAGLGGNTAAGGSDFAAQMQSHYADSMAGLATGPATAQTTAQAAGQQAATDYAALYGNVNDVLGKGAPTIYAYGNAITALNTGIASRQTNLNVATYAESIRIMNRNIGYAKGVVTGQGATSGANANLGALERLSFTLSRASESLSIALSQRQINFSVAVAGFQAPGITGQERGARTQEAMVQAQYGQAQLDIQKQQFTISKVVFDTQAQNALTDLSIQRSLSAQTFSVEQQTLADQKRISALQIVQGQLEAKAQAILDQAQSGFGSTLNSAGGFVSQFSGSIKDATDAIRGAIGLQPLYSTPTAAAAAATAANTLRPGLNVPGVPHASGLLGMTSGPTALGVAGEVAGEAVAILRNPRPLSASNGVSAPMGGGGMTFSVVITGNTISSDMDLEKLARVLAEKVEQRIGQKANLLNAPRAFS